MKKPTKIADCLNRLRFENTRYKKISEQHEGSLEWLWTNQDYLAWSSATSSDLFLIEGKPGSGKSTLMKYFQRSLQDPNSSAGSKRQIVASFYYSYREGEKQTNHCNMLRSVLYEVLNQNEEFFFHFQPYYREVAQGGGHPWPYESLKGILLSLAKRHPVKERLYLIVDAMDEADGGDQRLDVIKLFHELCTAEGSCIVKVFAASRPVDGLSVYLTEHHKVIRLQDFNKSDILKFAESFLRGPGLGLPPTIADSAKEYIARNAQGVFIWVHLIREELLKYARKGCTENEIFEFLESLPTELEGIYQRILKRLEEGEKRDLEVGQRMFQFVLFAYRPLGLEELRQALAIPGNLESEFSLSDQSFQRNLIHGIEKRIVSCADNFLEVKARGDHGSMSAQYIPVIGAVSLMNMQKVRLFRSCTKPFGNSLGLKAPQQRRSSKSTARTSTQECPSLVSGICCFALPELRRYIRQQEVRVGPLSSSKHMRST